MKVPTLVVHGTADIPVPIALARFTAQGIAGAKLIEYEGVSHGLVVTERDRVTRDLLAFVQRTRIARLEVAGDFGGLLVQRGADAVAAKIANDAQAAPARNTFDGVSDAIQTRALTSMLTMSPAASRR